MNRFELASDLRDVVRACLGADCEYKLVVTRGEPTVECNLIAFWHGDQGVDQFGDCGDDCDPRHTSSILVKVARVCMAPGGDIDMDYEADEAEAQCFYADLEVVECCLADSDSLRQLRLDHDLERVERVRTRIAPAVRGGVYEANIELRLVGDTCC